MKQSTFARKVLRTLVDNGWILMNDLTPAKVMDELVHRDELSVGARHPEHGKSFVWFVWQGPDDNIEDGAEILADYGMKLDPLLAPLLN